MPEVIGIDHIYISVSNLERAAHFYDALLVQVLGFRKQHFSLGSEPHIQYYNRHFGYVLRPARVDRPFDAYGPGLHHFCLRVGSVADVQNAAHALQALGFSGAEARHFPEYAPDYWACFITDPDGVRLEITNFRQERQARHDHWEDQPT
ncbi:MAG: VOC family protein [Zoogloea sp.]|uniref:VOC family protein n=1 Tax=Zoogloea sp. TaxID=49181 RepID=UPI003F36834F